MNLLNGKKTKMQNYFRQKKTQINILCLRNNDPNVHKSFNNISKTLGREGFTLSFDEVFDKNKK